MRMWGSGVAMMALAACDPVDPGFLDEPPSAFETLDAAYSALASDVAALPAATTADMPTEGGATYEGYAALALDTDAATRLVGTASLVADFDGVATSAGDVSGTLGGFSGVVDGGPEQAFSGTLDLAGGAIGGASAGGFTTGLSGRLVGTTAVVDVAGSMTGTFRSGDQPASALEATSDPLTSFALDGAAVGGTLAVAATR